MPTRTVGERTVSGAAGWRRVVAFAAAVAILPAGLTLGQTEVSAAPATAASATLTDPPQFDGMTGQPGDAKESYDAAAAEFDGRACWLADPEVGNDFLYFGVDEARMPADADTATVTVDYYDDGPGNFTIHYDGQYDAFTRGEAVSMPGEGTWKSHEFQLDNIQFDNRTNDHDFRISNWDQRFGMSETPVCVAEVRVAFSNTIPDLEIQQAVLGNIFVRPAVPRLRIETRGDAVSWVVRDYRGAQVARGSGDVPADGTLTLDLGGVDDLGYYEVDVTAERDGAPIKTLTTDMALLEPFDVADVKESPFGTVPHFTREDNLDKVALAATMGAKNVREAALWKSVERKPGTYQFDRYESLVPELSDQGMRWLPVGSYINEHYDGGATPYTDAGREGYGNYLAAVADHYRGQVEWIEIYNEFNIKMFGAKGGSPANSQANYYFPLLKKAYQKIKETNPDVTVVGGGTSSVPLDWLEELFALGGLKYMDAISVHPYVFPSEPEDATQLLVELKKLIREYNDGKLIPIWITEQGYPTHQRAKGVTESEQAENLVRSYAVALSQGVQKMFWYNFMNEGTSDTAVGHNYGLIRNYADERGRYVPKPGYVSYATMARELTGSDYQRTEDLGAVTSYLFTGHGEDVRVLWAKQPTTVTVKSDEPVTVTSLMGDSRTYRPHAGRVHLSVSDAPLYLRGNDVQLSTTGKIRLAPADGSTEIVGDQVDLALTVDNTVPPRAPVEGDLEIGGNSVPVSVRPGERATIPVTMPAEDVTGPRGFVGDLVLRGRDAPSARLATTVQVSHPIEMTARHVLDGGDDALRVEVSNVADRAISVGALDWTVGERSGQIDLAGSLPAHTGRTVMVPLKDTPTGTHDYTLRLPVTGYDEATDDGTVEIVADTDLVGVDKQTIDVDGTLDDMTGVAGIDLATDGRLGGRWTTASEPKWIYGGEDDLSGDVWPTWDDSNLYLSARVRDNIHHQRNPAPTVWAGDSMTVTVSAGSPSDERPQQYYVYRAALTEDGPLVYRSVSGGKAPLGVVDNAALEVTRDDAADETVYELAIPWRQLAPSRPDDRLLSVSVQVDDNDGLDRKGWIKWPLRPVVLATSQ